MYGNKYEFSDFMQIDVLDNCDVVATDPRIIYSPNKKLKAFHVFLNLFLFEFLPIRADVVFSYRKGFSAFDAVSRHKNGKHFFQTDISSFFLTIDRELIKRVIVAGKSESPIIDLDDAIDRIIDLVCIDDFLPIGFPSSAPISNAVLYEFDNFLKEFCNKNNLVYTRYSDDIIISSMTAEGLIGIDNEIERLLHVYAGDKFQLNRKKSKYFGVGGKVKILGMMILPNGKITVDSRLKRDLEVLLYTYLKNREKFHEIVGKDEDVGLDRLSGILNYSNSIDQDYIDKLRRKFGTTTIDTFLHRPLSGRRSNS